MSDDDDIPVLNVLREKLMAGIAGDRGRRGRLPPRRALLAIGVAMALIAAIVVATRPSAKHHRVLVAVGSLGGPFAAVPQTANVGSAITSSSATTLSLPADTQPSSTTSPASGVVTAPGAPPAPTTTIHAPTPPPGITTSTSVASPPRGLGTPIVLGVVDSGRTIALPRGTTVQVSLAAGDAAIWPHPPTSSNTAVLEPTTESSTPTSSVAAFDAVGPGTATLGATGGPPCSVQPPPTGSPQACPAYAAVWSVTVTVT